MPRNGAIGLAALVIIFAAVGYATPVGDGDLFWHMAYARQMLDRGTLIPDARLYSWTPTGNVMIYCAWLSEMTLYGVWRLTGLAGIFALRYAIVGYVLLLACLFARRQRLATAPLLFFLLVLLVQFVYSGTLPKAEMFSLAFFASVVFVYATFRASVLSTPTAARRLYAVPLIMLVWVNCHGVFMLSSLFLAATAFGEILFFAFGAEARLSRKNLLHLLAAWALCGVAVLATPYGVRYPAGLINEFLLGGVERPDAYWNTAHRSIFDVSVGYSLIEGLAAMVALFAALVVMAWRRRGKAVLGWLPLALAAACYLPLYAAFLRSTHFLPIVFSFLALALGGMIVGERPAKTTAEKNTPRAPLFGATLVGALALGGIADAVLHPPGTGWVGFGIDTVSPVAEAEFLARQKELGPNIYNVFDSGGYLLWRLYPHYKVMTDSRSFPYLSWFADQYAFTMGTSFEPFVQKYPAEVAVIDLAKPGMWGNFLKTKDWRLVFYGPTAAIFVRQDRLASVERVTVDTAPLRFADLNSEAAAIHVFEFATFVGDYKAANVVLQRLQTALWWRTPSAELKKAEAYRDAIRAIGENKFAEALEQFELGLWGRPVSDRDRLVLTLLVSLVNTPEQLNEQKRQQVIDALKRILPAGF